MANYRHRSQRPGRCSSTLESPYRPYGRPNPPAARPPPMCSARFSMPAPAGNAG